MWKVIAWPDEWQWEDVACWDARRQGKSGLRWRAYRDCGCFGSNSNPKPSRVSTTGTISHSRRSRTTLREKNQPCMVAWVVTVSHPGLTGVSFHGAIWSQDLNTSAVCRSLGIDQKVSIRLTGRCCCMITPQQCHLLNIKLWQCCF